MWTTYWWIVDDENSDICGEEFFTELKDADRARHTAYVRNLFPHDHVKCLGRVTMEEAEMMGLDTY